MLYNIILKRKGKRKKKEAVGVHESKNLKPTPFTFQSR